MPLCGYKQWLAHEGCTCLRGQLSQSKKGACIKPVRPGGHVQKRSTQSQHFDTQGLLYYLGVDACEALFRDASEACPCGSWMIASMVTKASFGWFSLIDYLQDH
eukprot:1141594-Pelagomonas_calceolata.AAC.3